MFPAGCHIRLGMVVPEGFITVGEGAEVEDGEVDFRFSYVEEPLGHEMPDTLGVGR